MAASEGRAGTGLQRIILGSDGSEYSEGAVREAIDWAKRYGSQLYAVCTAEVGLGQLEYAPEAVETLDRAARQACEAIKQRADAEGVACEMIIHEGEEPYAHIVNEARERNADGIVLGRRGRRGLNKLMMGSVTQLVIGHAPCKVFVVPRAGHLLAQRVLVATDGSEHSERAARQAVGLAALTGGTVIACAVTQRGIDANAARANADRIKAIADDAGVTAETVTGEGRPYEEILNAASQHNADLIAMGSHGHTALYRLMMGSVADRVLRLADRSMMIVR